MLGARSALIGLTLAVGACAGPSPSATVSLPATPGDASAVIRLSGREIQLFGGSCTWFEAEGRLVVQVGPNAAGDSLELIAPLAWSADEIPPGAVSGTPEIHLRLAGTDAPVDPTTLEGQMAVDAGAGSFSAQTAGGGPVTGEFACPTVIDG